MQTRESTWGVVDDCVFEGNLGLGEHRHKPNALISHAVDVSDADHGGHGSAIAIEQSSDFNLTSPKFRSNRQMALEGQCTAQNLWTWH